MILSEAVRDTCAMARNRRPEIFRDRGSNHRPSGSRSLLPTLRGRRRSPKVFGARGDCQRPSGRRLLPTAHRGRLVWRVSDTVRERGRLECTTLYSPLVRAVDAADGIRAHRAGAATVSAAAVASRRTQHGLTVFGVTPSGARPGMSTSVVELRWSSDDQGEACSSFGGRGLKPAPPHPFGERAVGCESATKRASAHARHPLFGVCGVHEEDCVGQPACGRRAGFMVQTESNDRSWYGGIDRTFNACGDPLSPMVESVLLKRPFPRANGTGPREGGARVIL